MLLCVLLWAHPGQAQMLADYEDQVLSLLTRHGGRVASRVRVVDPPAGPTEVQLLEFAAENGLETFLSDPDRTQMADIRDQCIARTEVLRGEAVEPMG